MMYFLPTKTDNVLDQNIFFLQIRLADAALFFGVKYV